MIIVITVEVGIGLAVQVHTRLHLQGVLLGWREVVLSDRLWLADLTMCTEILPVGFRLYCRNLSSPPTSWVCIGLYDDQ